jgi:ISXO2-like transposase domain/Transposase zinc-ribbon domain
MSINTIQFQEGLSMAEFMAAYGSEDKCEAALMASRWPRGFACPVCGGEAHSAFRRGGLLYLQCSACRYQCSLTSGTIFASTKLALTQWFLALHLLTQTKNNVSALELKRHVGVCYKTAWLLKHKVLEVMRERESTRRLTGRVEMDDAYLGGELSDGKRGRGSQNKVPFVAAVQTSENGQPRLVCYSQQPFTKDAMADFCGRSLALPLTLVSDGLACFSVVEDFGAVHERTVTGGGKASVKLSQHRAINTMLGNLKSSLTGTYHAFDFTKYAHRYLAEAQYRFNRRFDLGSILKRLLRAASVTSPRPANIIRMAEVGH